MIFFCGYDINYRRGGSRPLRPPHNGGSNSANNCNISESENGKWNSDYLCKGRRTCNNGFCEGSRWLWQFFNYYPSYFIWKSFCYCFITLCICCKKKIKI